MQLDPTAFDPTQFKLDYPQFATLSDNYLQNVYEFEALTLGDKIIALFNNVDYAYYWSCVVLAHILTLTGNNNTGTFQTGRTSQATEGSVSGTFANVDTESADWWNLTAYGQKCWQLVRKRGGATWFSGGTSAGLFGIPNNVFYY